MRASTDGTMKILVVDDEPMQCDMLGGFLEKQGYAVATAANGRRRWISLAGSPFNWFCWITACPI